MLPEVICHIMSSVLSAETRPYGVVWLRYRIHHK